jgi:hypothetical protein
VRRFSSNNGKEIKEEEFSIDDKFINLSKSKCKKKPIRLGLGLAICKQIEDTTKGIFGSALGNGAYLFSHYPIIIQLKKIK